MAHATSRGVTVVLDPHNYARYNGTVIGPGGAVTHAHFADFWSRLALHYAGAPQVVFALMNEPHGLPTEQWLDSANAAIAAIRAAGATQLVLVPGNGWTGAHSWHSDWYGTPNAQVMGNVVDPLGHYAFELHQYFDQDLRTAFHNGLNAQALAGGVRLEQVVRRAGARTFANIKSLGGR